MTRTIVSFRDVSQPAAAAFPALAGQTPPPSVPDDYKSRLMKYIPAEVITLYVTLDAVIRSSPASDQVATASWVVFVFGLVATPLYLWRVSKVSKVVQLALSTGAFVVWVFALGGPFASIEWVAAHKLIGALVLPLYTFLIPLIDP